MMPANRFRSVLSSRVLVCFGENGGQRIAELDP